MNAKEMLLEVADLFSNPQKWTQDWYARDAHDIELAPESADAVCFCLWGALRNMFPEDFNQSDEPQTRKGKIAYKALTDVINAKFPHRTWEVTPIVDFNDKIAETNEDVVAILKQAAERVNNI